MPISASDIVMHAPINSPRDDVSTLGGGIDLNSRIMTDILSSREKLQASSSSSSDTARLLTIRGLSFGGLEIVEMIRLNGTVTVKGITEFRKIVEVTLDAAAVGTITIKKQSDAVTILTIAVGITKYTTLLKYVRPSEGITETRYDKVFMKNVHATLPLVNAASILSIDGSSYLSIGLAAAVNDSVSVANRFTAPGGVTFSAKSTYVDVPGANLAAGAAIGVWIKQAALADLFVSEANAKPQLAIAGS